MTHLVGHDRCQTLLLPESLDDYVGADNPVRFIDAFVDGLDLAAAGFGRVQPKATGRPGYAPGDLLKLYIYGYLNRIRSSRRLEAETHRNLEVIWLLWHLKPGFKTIADFRRNNRNAFRPVFRQFVLFAPGQTKFITCRNSCLTSAAPYKGSPINAAARSTRIGALRRCTEPRRLPGDSARQPCRPR